jgi:hypothetical protein
MLFINMRMHIFNGIRMLKECSFSLNSCMSITTSTNAATSTRLFRFLAAPVDNSPLIVFRLLCLNVYIRVDGNAWAILPVQYGGFYPNVDSYLPDAKV